MAAGVGSAVELAEYEAWERKQSGWEFNRSEERHSSRRRLLDCGHTIDAREPYRYFVGKARGLLGLIQVRDCDVCKRKDDRY